MNNRQCSNCGTHSSEVYVFDSGEHYACSDSCRDIIASEVYQSLWEDLATTYDEDIDEYITDENFYYTEL